MWQRERIDFDYIYSWQIISKLMEKNLYDHRTNLGGHYLLCCYGPSLSLNFIKTGMSPQKWHTIWFKNLEELITPLMLSTSIDKDLSFKVIFIVFNSNYLGWVTDKNMKLWNFMKKPRRLAWTKEWIDKKFKD